MGEVLSFGFNLAVLDPRDRRGTDTYCIVAIKDKRWGYIILLEFIPLHHVIFLNALLYSCELNTLDAGRSRSMCGVIVVDAESFRSTFCGRDAYIHNHA